MRGDFITIPLSLGKSTLISPEDAGLILTSSWHAKRPPNTSTWYAGSQRNGKHVLLHRLITGAAPGQLVDHMNRNGLDNRRGNLRLATNAQNCANRRPQRRGCQFKGVSYYSRYKVRKYRALITHQRRQIFLGFFETAEEAALAYDAAARRLFGEFAYLNFPTH